MPRKKKSDPGKNRKLAEFLSEINIDDDRKDKIMEFVEKLTFEKVKEATRKSKT
ncbi:hypothetical protein HYX10_03885 [Candidatus Woesearchaeota archaeon]|nr:hypothetical protein [Candidatus Woesearchaeota archaeon]